jgi:hypothetical protein
MPRALTQQKQPESTSMDTTTKWRSFATYWRHVFHAALSRGPGVAHAAHPPDLYRSTPQHGPFLR